MPHSNSQVLAAIIHSIEQDQETREEIKRSLDSHDKNLFAQMILNVLTRLQRTSTDIKELIDAAYEWFRNRL